MAIAAQCLAEYKADDNIYKKMAWYAETIHKGKLITYANITKYEFKDKSRLIYNPHFGTWGELIK